MVNSQSLLDDVVKFVSVAAREFNESLQQRLYEKFQITPNSYSLRVTFCPLAVKQKLSTVEGGYVWPKGIRVTLSDEPVPTELIDRLLKLKLPRKNLMLIQMFRDNGNKPISCDYLKREYKIWHSHVSNWRVLMRGYGLPVMIAITNDGNSYYLSMVKPPL